ncbi:hypothetical protein BC830DRAFT_1145213 [Chytriomyces sp. MP71]|nr:hypothetical protein BC830DRAFT_1145213 [Chytriomyces sp. MP71]
MLLTGHAHFQVRTMAEKDAHHTPPPWGTGTRHGRRRPQSVREKIPLPHHDGGEHVQQKLPTKGGRGGKRRTQGRQGPVIGTGRALRVGQGGCRRRRRIRKCTGWWGCERAQGAERTQECGADCEAAQGQGAAAGQDGAACREQVCQVRGKRRWWEGGSTEGQKVDFLILHFKEYTFVEK